MVVSSFVPFFSSRWRYWSCSWAKDLFLVVSQLVIILTVAALISAAKSDQKMSPSHETYIELCFFKLPFSCYWVLVSNPFSYLVLIKQNVFNVVFIKPRLLRIYLNQLEFQLDRAWHVECLERRVLQHPSVFVS